MQAVDRGFEGGETHKYSPRLWVMVPLISFVFPLCLEGQSMGPCALHIHVVRTNY